MSSSLFSIILIWGSTIITGVINYLYHPVMLRFLPIETFAEFESLVGVFNVLGVITGSFTIFLVKEIVQRRNREEVAKFVVSRFGKLFFFASLGLYVVYAALIPVVQNILQIPEWLPVALVGTILIVSFVNTPPGAVVQALERFRFVAANNIAASVLRLSFWIGFVLMGTSLTLAVFGFVVSSLVSAAVSIGYVWWILRKIPDGHPEFQNEIERDFKNELPNLMQFFVLSVLLAVMMNMDIILATRFFEKEVAGGYAAVSVLAKFIMFVIGAIDTVYYPKVAGAKDPTLFRLYIRNSSVLMVLAALAGGVWALWLGALLLGILKPGFERYAALFTGLIPVFAMYAGITYYSKILIAAKRYWVNAIVALGVAIFVIPVAIFPPILELVSGRFEAPLISIYAVLLGISVGISLLGTLVMVWQSARWRWSDWASGKEVPLS